MPQASLNILIVEDHPDVARLMVSLVKSLGHTPAMVNTAAAAKAIKLSETFDLILSDYNLGDGTGLDVLRAPAATHPPAPTIVLTAYPDIVRNAERLGFQAGLLKPVDAKALQQAIDRAVA